MEHPIKTSDQQPPASGPELHDQLDDDYWFDQMFRAPRLLGFLRIEELEKQLQADTWAEFQQRAESEPEELRAERLERERRLRELVMRANETDDPELWQEVDALVFGQTAAETAPEAL